MKRLLLLAVVALATARSVCQDPFARATLGPADRDTASALLGAAPEALLRDISSKDRGARRAAGLRLRELDFALQARLLRALLWSEDQQVALGASLVLPAWWLDVREAERALALQLPVAFERGTVVDLADLGHLIRAADMPGLLADPLPLPREAPDYLMPLHRAMRAEHLPLLARLTICDDAIVRQAALETLRVVAEYTDRQRENVASALLTWPGGVPVRLRFDATRQKDPVTPRPFQLPEPTGGYPPMLALALRRVLVAPADQRIRNFETWVFHWACAERAAAGDLGLVRGLARRPGEARVLAARAAADVGDRELLASLADDQDPGVAALAAAGLAALGDAAARARLADDPRPAFLAARLELALRETLDALAPEVVGSDRLAARAAVQRVVAACAVARQVPIRVPASLGRELADLAVAGGASSAALAALAEEIPDARTAQLAAAWRGSLDAETLTSPALAFLEVAGREALVARLRALAADDPDARHGALVALLVLGDQASAAQLVDLVRASDDGVLDGELVEQPWLALARSPSDAVRDYLLEAIGESSGDYRGVSCLAALERLRGVDERLARSFADDLIGLDERRLADLWPGLVAAARGGAAGDAIVAWLDQRPVGEGRLLGLGGLDRSEALEYLRRAAIEREHGLLWWASGELGLRGDSAARAQVESAIRSGWYRWIESVDPFVLTDGGDLSTAARWVEQLATNCCGSVVARGVLESLVGERVPGLDEDGVRPPTEPAREFFRRYGARLRASRIAGHFVVGPG